MMASVIQGSPSRPSMMPSIYFPPCLRKDMKKSAYLLFIILLSSSISGCTGEVEEATGEDEKEEDMSGADLSYTNMSDRDLSYVNLSAANLNYTMLQGADLRHADLRHAWLTGADLTGADLRYAVLNGAWLNGANLTGAYLSGAYLSGANLYDANLTGADLIYAYLRYATLYDADLSDAILHNADLRFAGLTGADLGRASLSGADLGGADLRHSILYFADLSNANLTGADLSDAILYNADLRYADLSDANLNVANLSGADLHRADLSNANLTGADLTGTDLSYADLSGTIWYGTICPDGTNSDENGNTCENELQSDPFPYSCPIGSSISGTVTDSIYSNPGVVFSDDSNLPDDHNPQAIQFRVTLDGSPLEGCEIRFEIEDGNGWFFPAFRQTNNNGDLHGYWTAGSIIGDQTMSAYITWSSGERRYLNISGEVTDTSTRTNSIHLNYEPSGEYEEFSIRATPGTGPLATYYSTINWAGSYGGIQFDGDTTKVLFSTWDTNGMDAEIIDDGSCNVVHDFGGEGTGVSCRLILPPSVHGSIPGLPDDYMLVPGDTYETSIQISDCGTNCQDYSFFFTDITRGLGPISLGTQRYKSDWTNNWASSFVEEWWPHGNCLSAERSVLFHDVKAKVNGEWEYFDQARFTPNYIPSNNEICANYYAEGTEDGFQLSSGGDRLVGQPRISGDSYFPYTRYIDIIVG